MYGYHWEKIDVDHHSLPDGIASSPTSMRHNPGNENIYLVHDGYSIAAIAI